MLQIYEFDFTLKLKELDFLNKYSSRFVLLKTF